MSSKEVKNPAIRLFPKRERSRQSIAMMKLRRLVRNFRNCPIYVEVDGELSEDLGCCSSYYGSIQTAYLDEIYLGDEKVWSRQDTTKRGELTQDDMDLIEYEAPIELQKQWGAMSDKDRERAMRKWENNLPWQKCIILYVGELDPIREEVGGL